MSRGFVTLGINTDKDMIKYSYGLALSIKASDPTAETCLIVDNGKSDLVPSKYFHAFDYITELPFGNTAHKDGFHGMNIWQLIHATPFEETIYADYDTLFNNVDIELLWDHMTNNSTGFSVSSVARTFRNNILNYRNYFDIELHYNLPTNFNNLIYFNRGSEIAINWFKMADPVFQNWRDIYSKILTDKKPASFDSNVLSNIVTHLLDVNTEVVTNLNNLYDLDLRSQGLWSEDIPVNWSEMLNHWYTDELTLIIENYNIKNGIIHYRDKSFLTEDVLNVIRTKINTNSR
jgi:hypothetical protein